MRIDKIENGIVLDHIKAGKALLIYKSLHLDEQDCAIAIITNVSSNRMGKKDILKFDSILDLDYDILGYLDKGITVNVIRNGEPAEKKTLTLPKEIKGIIHCKNPRCITSVERAIEHKFYLANEKEGIYRCAYCEEKYHG